MRLQYNRYCMFEIPVVNQTQPEFLIEEKVEEEERREKITLL